MWPTKLKVFIIWRFTEKVCGTLPGTSEHCLTGPVLERKPSSLGSLEIVKR